MKWTDIKKYTIRMLPCSAYENVIMENWLEDLAQQGLVLHKISFGMAIFEKQEPQKLRYRLSVIPTKTDGYDNLNSKRELISLCADAGWRFICERGHFAIFVTDDASAEELHTEPELQYLDYKDYVKWSAVLGEILSVAAAFCLLWVVFFQNGFFLNWMHQGGAIFFALLAVIIANIISAIRQLVCPLMLYRKMKANGISHEKQPWQAHAVRYRIMATMALVVYVGGFGYMGWYFTELLSFDERNNVSTIAECEDELPVPSLDDIMLLQYPDAVLKEKTRDWVLQEKRILAPVMRVIEEDAVYQLADGTSMQCCLLIEYYDTKSPWLAKRLADDQMKKAEMSVWYKPMGTPNLDVDYTIAYQAGYPTILFVQDNVYVNVGISFGEQQDLQQMEQWGKVYADCLKE